MILQGMGIQMTTTFMSGRNSTRFIPFTEISHLIMNEGITMFKVKYYLAMVLKNQDDMVVLFPVSFFKLNYLMDFQNLN